MRCILLALTLAACTGAPPAPAPAPKAVEPAPAPPSPAAQERADRQAYWTQRTDAELDAAFAEVCTASLKDGKPVLVVFSAEWCPDCKRMYAMGKQAPLSDELEQWHKIVVDPGRLDRHTATLEAFGVDRIVTWVAARPTDCSAAAASWPRLKQAVFEPQTGEPWTGAEITDWLTQARQAEAG